MTNYYSLVFRLTGIIFFLFIMTIGILLFLVNYQMDAHFSHYLYNHSMEMGITSHGMAEEIYVSSVHRSLLWVGAVMTLLSVFISWIVIRWSIQPLQDLTEAVRHVEAGSFGETVLVDRQDEVGLLAQSFNAMSKKLQYNDTMRRHLFASIAHELRTPLAIIQGNLEGMIDNVIPADKKTFLSLEDEVLRVSRLVQDLRDLSLAEINELQLHCHPLQINDLLQQAASMLEPLFEEKQLQVRLSADDEVPPLSLDKDRMNQVIYNLLNNAIRYVPCGGAVFIQSRLRRLKNGQRVEICIADSGPGISHQDVPHIFEYFYRAEKSRNRKSGGSGIGLALARQYVINQGGYIRVHSKEGKGTIFTICFPIL